MYTAGSYTEVSRKWLSNFTVKMFEIYNFLNVVINDRFKYNIELIIFDNIILYRYTLYDSDNRVTGRGYMLQDSFRRSLCHISIVAQPLHFKSTTEQQLPVVCTALYPLCMYYRRRRIVDHNNITVIINDSTPNIEVVTIVAVVVCYVYDILYYI